jgi:hypothetical protein
MARLYFATFWLIVFTGTLRKWVFPGVTALYLLQDVPIALAYLHALRSGLFTRSYMMLGVILLSTLVTLQALMQIIISGLNITVGCASLQSIAETLSGGIWS